MWLEYSVARDGRLVAHVLPLTEILDFQTTVVLATSHDQQDEVSNSVVVSIIK